jgi:lipid-binding SYLF domain-containing protein
MRGVVLTVFFVTAVLLSPDLLGVAQKPSTNKFPDAIERSQDAARIAPLLTLIPESGVPKELTDKAEAIGIFPKVTRDTVYFTHLIRGYGVISARQESGWTMPAFYQFMGSGFGNPFSQKENYGVVMLFMSKDAVGWFEKGGVPLKDEKTAVVGPVGTITDAQRKEIQNAQLIAYVYYNGKLVGTSYGKRFELNPDNKINTPLYGMKGREVLAGNKTDPASLPAGISSFQESLQKYFRR